MAENKGIEGIAGALGKAGAAMIDQSQGTQFYQEIVDREKEDRARQFALDQLAEQKQQLNNENAQRSIASLVEAFGTRVRSAQSVPENVTANAVSTLQNDSLALAQRLQNNQDLDPLSREVFATQLNSLLPQIDSLQDNAVVNQVAGLETTQQRWGSLPELTPRQTAMVLASPKFTEDNLKGEAAVLALSNLDDDALQFLSEEQKGLAKFIAANPGETYASIATQSPVYGQLLAQTNAQSIAQGVSRAKFINRELPQMKQELEVALAMSPEEEVLFGPLADIDWEGTFNDDNVVTNSKGEFGLRTSHTQKISEAALAVKASLKDKTIADLVDMQTAAVRFDGLLNTDLSIAINNAAQERVEAEGFSALDELLEKRENNRDERFSELVLTIPQDEFKFDPSEFGNEMWQDPENLTRLEELNAMPTFREKHAALNKRGGYFKGYSHPLGKRFVDSYEKGTSASTQARAEEVRSLILGSFVPPVEDELAVQTFIDNQMRLRRSFALNGMPTVGIDSEIEAAERQRATSSTNTFRLPFVRFLQNAMMQEFNEGEDTAFQSAAESKMRDLLGENFELTTGLEAGALGNSSRPRFDRALEFYEINAASLGKKMLGSDGGNLGLAIATELKNDIKHTVAQINSFAVEDPTFIIRALELLGLEEQEGVDPAVTLALGALE